MTQAFRGIDYADNGEKCGECFLIDDGAVLRTSEARTTDPSRVAIDAPMGLPRAYAELLDGTLPEQHGSLTYRATEAALRAHIESLSVVKNFSPKPVSRLFSVTAHIRSPAALQIVPGAIKRALELELAHDASRSQDDAVRDAPRRSGKEALTRIRRGDGHVVEGHPRLFLYSLLEKCASFVNATVMTAARDYKDISRKTDKPKERKKRHENRRTLRDLICKRPTWTGPEHRLVEADDAVLASDHKFDAWLCALTAWSHEKQLTWTWRHAGLSELDAEQEGHILVLR